MSMSVSSAAVGVWHPGILGTLTAVLFVIALLAVASIGSPIRQVFERA